MHSVVFSQNGFSDETHSILLGALGSKTRSVISVRNIIGGLTLEAIVGIIRPPDIIVEEIAVKP